MAPYTTSGRYALLVIVTVALATAPISAVPMHEDRVTATPASVERATDSSVSTTQTTVGPTSTTQTTVGPVLALDPTVGQLDDPTETAACLEEADVDDRMPETRDEFLATFRTMNGTAAFGSYTEFEIIRSQVLLNVQAGSFETSDREQSQQVVRLLRRFTEAYACQQSGEFAAALALANDTDAVASELAASGNGQFGALADLALTRFYTRLGEELRARGETIDRTPDRIETFELAALAFRRAGATDQFAQLSVRLDETRQTYQADMSQYNESMAAAGSFVDGCGACVSPGTALAAFGTGVFDRYLGARTASTETAEAAELARKHALEDRAARAESLGADVAATRDSLAVAAAGGMVGFAAVVALVAGLLGSRLAAWRRDLRDTQVGNVVLVGEMLDA